MPRAHISLTCRGSDVLTGTNKSINFSANIKFKSNENQRMALNNVYIFPTRMEEMPCQMSHSSSAWKKKKKRNLNYP